MKLASPLHKAKLIKRYKRFLADVTLEGGEKITAYCANTGSMESCGSPGDTVYLSYHPDSKRKLLYTWELTKLPAKGHIVVNTALPNYIVEEAVSKGLVKELAGYDLIKREVKYGKNSRIDLLLTGKGRPDCYVEVKNTTLLRDGALMFPDAVTVRGRKHLDELSAMVKGGQRAVMFYLVNRPDGDYFRPAKEIDEEYAKSLKKAVKSGVEVVVYRTKTLVRSAVGSVTVDEPVKVKLN